MSPHATETTLFLSGALLVPVKQELGLVHVAETLHTSEMARAQHLIRATSLSVGALLMR